VQNPGTDNYISSDIEALKYSDKSVTGCQSWLHLFKEGTQRFYGVHDEIRGIAPAIQGLLKMASAKVCQSVSSSFHLLKTYTLPWS